jgi:hypothetical protein
VAIGTEAEWRGVYNHSDSYPTELGRAVWEFIEIVDDLNLGAFLTYDSEDESGG